MIDVPEMVTGCGEGGNSSLRRKATPLDVVTPDSWHALGLTEDHVQQVQQQQADPEVVHVYHPTPGSAAPWASNCAASLARAAAEGRRRATQGPLEHPEQTQKAVRRRSRFRAFPKINSGSQRMNSTTQDSHCVAPTGGAAYSRVLQAPQTPLGASYCLPTKTSVAAKRVWGAYSIRCAHIRPDTVALLCRHSSPFHPSLLEVRYLLVCVVNAAAGAVSAAVFLRYRARELRGVPRRAWYAYGSAFQQHLNRSSPELRLLLHIRNGHAASDQSAHPTVLYPGLFSASSIAGCEYPQIILSAPRPHRTHTPLWSKREEQGLEDAERGRGAENRDWATHTTRERAKGGPLIDGERRAVSHSPAHKYTNSPLNSFCEGEGVSMGKTEKQTSLFIFEKRQAQKTYFILKDPRETAEWVAKYV
ncbi:hypothetical protein NDU88_010324 [Pleurodeles waltl]|uniref:PH domain-containing protein n=1 Tax=Pleurodeles waltl TaxID=8319 RepID=A0AAV7QX18_PLEWA|nr:hypothetical protein NDU88_010324 [Pleurodeles waltl]